MKPRLFLLDKKPKKVWQAYIKQRTKAATNGCWIWQKAVTNSGYGVVGVQHDRKRLMTFAHRISYYCFNGPLGQGLQVCHSCDNKLCCNPHHLWLGTRSDNVRDSHKKGRGRAKLTLKQARQIRRSYKGTDKHRRELAQKYGVAEVTIDSIVYGRNWAWIDLAN